MWFCNFDFVKRVIFDTKENNNKRREAEFLALSPAERVVEFLKMVDQFSIFPTGAPPEKKNNFVLEIPRK